MAMVDVDGSSLLADSQVVCFLGLRVNSHLALSLHSSNEPGELFQWICRDDSITWYYYISSWWWSWPAAAASRSVSSSCVIIGTVICCISRLCLLSNRHIIRAVMIGGKLSGLLCVQYCVQQLCTLQCTHMNRPNSCLLVRFSFSVVILCVIVICVTSRFSFLVLFYVIVYFCMCAFVVVRRLFFFSTMTIDWLARKNISEMICFVSSGT